MKDKLYCSFCGKHQDYIYKIITCQLDNICICNECVELCNQIMEDYPFTEKLEKDIKE